MFDVACDFVCKLEATSMLDGSTAPEALSSKACYKHMHNTHAKASII